MKQKENQSAFVAKKLASVVEDVKNFETKLREGMLPVYDCNMYAF